MRLVIVIPTMRLGGAQRAVSCMANHFTKKGHQICLLTFISGKESPEEQCFFPLDPGIVQRSLNLMREAPNTLQSLRNNFWRSRAIRNAITELQPDAVLCFTENAAIRTLLATRGLGLPVLACERTDPTFHRIGGAWRMLRTLCYPLASAVVVQTEAARKALPWPARRRALVIPNAVPAPTPGRNTAPKLPRPLMLSVGRLTPEKGYATLLRAFAKAANARPEWHLAILGDGPQHQELTTLGLELGLAGRLLMPGAVCDVGSWLTQTDVFALASCYEGFPNALSEALARGVPAIATATSGSAAVLRPGIDGLLTPVEDVEAMAQAMGLLMDDATLRQSMAARAPEIVARFGLERVMAVWEELLHRLVRSRKGGEAQ